MFAWLRERQRRKVMRQPMSAPMRHILASRFSHYIRLTESEKQKLCGLVQLFLAEKRVEGAGEFVVTDEVRILIAAHASLAVLNLPFDYLREFETVLVYPTDVLRPVPLFGDRTTHGELSHGETPLAGEAVHGGPILLSWDAVQGGAVHPDDGLNVIFHELAHKLDMVTGEADGSPPLGDRVDPSHWATVCGREYRHLRRRIDRGLDNFLDDYAAEHPAEFFAVVTETFFERAAELRRRRPALYRLFADFYAQDPAERP